MNTMNPKSPTNPKQAKLSELERLQLRRLKIQSELKVHVKSLDNNVHYIQHHFGSLLGNSTLSLVRGKLPPVVRQLVPGTIPHNRKLVNSGKNKWDIIADQAIDTLPLLYKGVRPVIIAFLLKRLKKWMFK